MPTESPAPSYAAAAAFFAKLKTRGVSLGLERMRRFVQELGGPEQSVPCIHIAGTNGKGSVAAMLESIFRAAGWRTGLYTSPHLVRLAERVQVDRVPITDGELAAYVAEMQPAVARLEHSGVDAAPSYFEFMTALAFLHFARRHCDIAFIEVGMGGRLDATNVVLPEVSVITSIGLDHCETLGDTVAAIAREKSGIIKSGVPVVIGRLPVEAERVVREVARTKGSRVFSVTETIGDDTATYPATNLEGAYQRVNAATATLVAHAMPARWRLEATTIERGLSAVEWSGRWQTFSVNGRKVIVDTSHNPEGAAVLEANLVQLVANTGRAPIIVTGVLGRSRAEALVPVVARHAKELWFVPPAQRRACSFEELASLVPASRSVSIRRGNLEDLFPSAGACAVGEEGETIVVTGSIYLAGEVLARLEPSRGRAETELHDF